MKFVNRSMSNAYHYIFCIVISVVLSPLAMAQTCELYPLTVSSDLLANSTDGAVFSQVKNGVGKGNYSWLSWDGRNDAPSLAESLSRPGNSEIYINPNDNQDTEISIGDWVQGRPGVKNSSAIRRNLDKLINLPIQIPLWSV